MKLPHIVAALSVIFTFGSIASAQGFPVFYPDTNGPNYVGGTMTDGCAEWAINVLTSTGSDCGSGSGPFPFTVTGYGVSTSTTVGFTNGLMAMASSTLATTTIANGYLLGTHNATGTMPTSRTTAGFAIGNNFKEDTGGIGAVDFWNLVESADQRNDPTGFKFRQKTGAASQALLASISGDRSDMTAFDVYGPGSNSLEVIIDTIGAAILTGNSALKIKADLILGSAAPDDTLPQATLHLGDTGSTARSYNAFTDTSNGEWAYMGDWGLSSNIATYGADKNGTGTYRNTQIVAGGSPRLTVTTGGVVGIGTTTPQGLLQIGHYYDYDYLPSFSLYASTTDSVEQNSAQAHILCRVDYTASRYCYNALNYALVNPAASDAIATTWQFGGEGDYLDAGTLNNSDFFIYDAVALEYRFLAHTFDGGTNNDGKVALGGNITNRGTLAGAGLVVTRSGDVGIATTTPQWPLTSYSATGPQLSLSADGGFSQWTFRNAGGTFYLATTTVAGTATSTTAALSIDQNGVLTVATGFAGSGLTDCDTAATSKLLWDASASRFSCGTDQTSGFAYPFPSNATSTLLAFNGGLTSYATSTIGDGTRTGGLTVNGTATTTDMVNLGDYLFHRTGAAGAAGFSVLNDGLTLSLFGGNNTPVAIQGIAGDMLTFDLAQFSQDRTAYWPNVSGDVMLANSSTTSRIPYWSSGLLTTDAGLTFNGSLFTTTLASTTQFSSASETFYIDSAGKVTAKDTTNGWSGRLSPTRSFGLSTGTTTTWTASTTNTAYSPYLVMPFAGTLRQVRCNTDASFLGVNTQVNGSNATPSYFVASTTVGKITYTAGNTFSAGQKILVNVGTTTTATAKSISCTFDVTET